ncbi:9194_t:CDS:2 [Cetraspora pellucida]|uniref:9194_t:CDS:1 n=1 Tax=Cetraspora pellucida TaxID=1433469 RepID=A0ACA9KNG8_9GLOM|nr:9194_t:CDS:2 [Cetraspora pellucida]
MTQTEFEEQKLSKLKSQLEQKEQEGQQNYQEQKDCLELTVGKRGVERNEADQHYWQCLETTIRSIKVRSGWDYKIIIMVDWKDIHADFALENEEEFKDLRDKYSSFRTCEECQQPNSGYHWCQTCGAKHFRKNFKK